MLCSLVSLELLRLRDPAKRGGWRSLRFLQNPGSSARLVAGMEPTATDPHMEEQAADTANVSAALDAEPSTDTAMEGLDVLSVESTAENAAVSEDVNAEVPLVEPMDEPVESPAPAADDSAARINRTKVEWVVDYAKSDRCECRRSAETIALGEVRVVKRTTSHAGFLMAYSYKVIPFFQMMNNMAAVTHKPSAASDFVGFHSLREADQNELNEYFRRFYDESEEFPPPEPKGRAAEAIRKHRRKRPGEVPQIDEATGEPLPEGRFLCPVPGCAKGYNSASCLYRHKRAKHPDFSVATALTAVGDASSPSAVPATIAVADVTPDAVITLPVEISMDALTSGAVAVGSPWGADASDLNQPVNAVLTGGESLPSSTQASPGGPATASPPPCHCPVTTLPPPCHPLPPPCHRPATTLPPPQPCCVLPLHDSVPPCKPSPDSCRACQTRALRWAPSYQRSRRFDCCTALRALGTSNPHALLRSSCAACLA